MKEYSDIVLDEGATKKLTALAIQYTLDHWPDFFYNNKAIKKSIGQALVITRDTLGIESEEDYMIDAHNTYLELYTKLYERLFDEGAEKIG